MGGLAVEWEVWWRRVISDSEILFLSSKAIATGWKVINKSRYYFYASGVMAKNTVIDEWEIEASSAVVGRAPQKLDFDYTIQIIIDFFRAYNI